MGRNDDNSQDAAHIALLCDSQDEGLSPELTLPCPQFVSFFARINVVLSLSTVGGRNYIRAPVIGGSRADPVRFSYACKNAIYGCQKTFNVPPAKERHEQICTLISDEAVQEHQRKQALYTWPCTEPGCTKRFRDREQRSHHIRYNHGNGAWIPKPCEHGCNPDKLLRSHTAHANHIKDYHGTYKAQKCPVEGCEHAKVFDKQCSLVDHMLLKHGVERDAGRKMCVANP